MKIMFVGPAPWIPSGYGKQIGIWANKFTEEGHEVEILCSYGLGGSPFTWNGIRVWPTHPDADFTHVVDVYRHSRPDVAIFLRDVREINPEVLREGGVKMAFWCPIDSEPMCLADRIIIQNSGGTPIAMSKFGKKMLREAKFAPLYVPHGINTVSTFYPPNVSKEDVKQSYGVGPEEFVIGINATNKDSERKAWAEQLEAFKIFHDKYPNSYLLLHTQTQDVGANLEVLIFELGIGEFVGTTEQFMLRQGLITDQMMRLWYWAVDLLSNCSQGEGFGIPIIEAQSCGVPVVVNNCSSMPEIAGTGWLVQNRRHRNATLDAYWRYPLIESIVEAYESAYFLWKSRKARSSHWTELQKDARETALAYDVERVYDKYWKPALAFLEKV